MDNFEQVSTRVGEKGFSPRLAGLPSATRLMPFLSQVAFRHGGFNPAVLPNAVRCGPGMDGRMPADIRDPARGGSN